MRKLLNSNYRRRDFVKMAGAAGATAAVMLNAPYVRAQNKTLRFLNAETSVDSIRVLQVAAAEYERQTGVNVVIDSVPVNEVFTKLTTSIKGGQPYDFATLGFIGHVLLLAGEGHILPMDDLVKKYEWGPRILFPINGKVYWYPYDYNLCNLYYRKDLYAQKGLKEPRTYDEMVANAAALTDGDTFGIGLPIGNDTATNWMSFAYMWANEVELLGDDWSVIFDNDTMKKRAVEYLDFYAELYKSMPPGMTQVSYGQELGLFASGKIAHGAYSGRMVEHLEKFAPDLTTNYAVMPYPDKDGSKRAVNHGYDGFVVLDTPQAEESMKFMEWFAEDQYINWLHSAPIHFHPPRLDVYEDPRWRAHPLIQKHKETVDTMQNYLLDDDIIIASIDTQGPEPDLRPGKIFESFALPEMLQSRLLQGTPSAECVEVAAEKMRKAIS